MDHTSGTAGAEVKDLSTKKAVISDQDFMMMDLNGDGVTVEVWNMLTNNRLVNVLMKVLNFS